MATYRRLAAALLALAAASGSFAADFPTGLPKDLWEILIPEGNPVTPEKVELGRKLYYDKRLSKDGTVSCATCHDPAKGFSDGKKVSEGIGGQKGTRNAPTVLNSIFYEFQFWDGRADSLEEQAKGPMINPVEMGMASHDDVVKAVRAVPEYASAFKAVFGREATIDDVVAAIATFERTVVSGNSRLRPLHGRGQGRDVRSGTARLGALERQGPLQHLPPLRRGHPQLLRQQVPQHRGGGQGPRFRRPWPARRPPEADPQKLAFHPDFSELGRFVTTKQPKDIGAFKTTGLRDIALSAPYMHDGSEATLLDVVKFYDKGGEPNPYLDGGIVPLKLTEQEMKDLVAFMESLTGEGNGSPTRAALLDPAK